MSEGPPPPAPEGTAGPDEAAPPAEAGRPGDKPGAEAARYRRQLQETRTERDALAATLERLRSREAERLAGEHLAQPGDLWTFGGAIADLLDEQGHIDAEKVTARVVALLGERPGLAKGAGVPSLDFGQGYRPPVDGGLSWSGVLRG